MLRDTIIFFAIALIAALADFSGLGAGTPGIANALFVVFLVMAVVAFSITFTRRQ